MIRDVNCIRLMSLVWVLLACQVGCRAAGSLLPDSWFVENNTEADGQLPGVPTLPMSEEAETSMLNNAQRADVQMVMGQSLEKQKNWEQAANVYKIVLQNDASRTDATHRLAVVLDMQGLHSDAEQHYRAALQQNPSDPLVYCDLGYCLYLQQKWPAAEESLRVALRLQPDLARAHNNLGLVLARTGRCDESLREFAMAGCQPYEARVNLAHSLILEERWQEAQQQCKLAIEDPAVSADVRRRAMQMNTTMSRAISPQVVPASHLVKLPAVTTEQIR